MAASKKARSISLRQALDIEVTPVPFVPFESLRTLDVHRLGRGRHVVELGQFEAGCCKRTARAVVKQGYVTEVAIDACSDGKVKASPELVKVMTRARKKLKLSTSPKARLPMPVARFFALNDHGGSDINLRIESICFRTCIDFFGTQICSVCCMVFSPGGGEQVNCGSIINPF